MEEDKYKSSIYEDMSIAENKVANLLRERGIWWNYEQPIYVKDNRGRPRVWTPDFFLPKLGIYIEVCGAKRRAYKFRKKVYEDNEMPVIFIQTYKSDKWESFLINEIKRISKDRLELINNL